MQYSFNWLSVGDDVVLQSCEERTYRINGVEGKALWVKRWYSFAGINPIDPETVKVEYLASPRTYKDKYVLKDKTLANDKIPEEVPVEALAREAYTDKYGDYDERYTTEFGEKYGYLYEEHYGQLPAEWVDITDKSQFFDKGLLVGDLTEPPSLKIEVRKKDRYTDVVQEVDVSEYVQYAEIYQAVSPEIALHKYPCFISGRGLYNLARAHVRRHIDPKVSQITSDYDFHFCVHKTVPLHTPIKKEILKSEGKSYARPRYRYENTKTLKIYDIGTEKKWGKVLDDVHGDNMEDLLNKIKDYLDNLIAYINEPITECPHCDGYGYVIDGVVDKTKV